MLLLLVANGTGMDWARDAQRYRGDKGVLRGTQAYARHPSRSDGRRAVQKPQVSVLK